MTRSLATARSVATRHLLHFSDEPGAAEALLLACSAHLDAGLAAASLQVALVPGVDQWHDANSFRTLATAVPLAAAAECSAALAHRLVGSIPAEAWLELSWHAATQATEQAGLAPYGAWTHALQRGLRCQVTVVSGTDKEEGADDPPPGPEPPPSIEHWCELLQASRLLLPASSPAAALTRLFETPCHWRGSVRLPGAELDGVRLCPHPEGGCAGGASSADPSEAPPAGSVLEALRPLRASQLPRHLRLPHRWEVRGTPGKESDRFLRQWAQSCDAECAADAMLVRVEPGTTSTSASALAPPARAQRARTSVRRQQSGSQGASTLLLFCEEGRVWAQACAEPGGLAAAVLYLECAEAGVAPEEEEREARTHTPAGEGAGGEVEGTMGDKEADGGSGGSGRSRRSSGRSSQERKRPAGPAAEEGAEGAEGEVRRRVRPREAPTEAGEAWAKRLDLNKAASFRETTRGPAAPARWRQAESRALQQLRLVAPPAATAEPPAAAAAEPPAVERHSSASNASSAPPPLPATAAAAAEMAPPAAADTCAATQPTRDEEFRPIASANPGLPLGLGSDLGPPCPDSSAQAGAAPQRRGPGSSAGSSASHASRASLHSHAPRNRGGSDRGTALQSSLAAAPRQRGAFGVAAKAAARPVQSNAAGGRARGHLLLSATGGSAGGAAASGGGGAGGGEEHGTAGPASALARQSSDGTATAAAAAVAATAGDGLGVTIQDVLRGCSDLVPTDADGGAIWPDLPDGPPPPPSAAWAGAAPYEGTERHVALERLLPAPEAEYCSLLCTSMPDVLPYARVGRFRPAPPEGRSTSRGAAAEPAAVRPRSAGPLGAPAAADEPPRMAEDGGPGSSVRKASAALVKRHAKRMLQQFATSCELFTCRAAKHEGFLKAEVAQVTQAALRELGKGIDLDVVSVKEPVAKAAVSEALCALMFAGAASLARKANVRGKPPIPAAAAASAPVDDGVP
jgi:hypothetical protein